MAHYMTFVYDNKLPFDGLLPETREQFGARWPILIDLYACGERFLNRPIKDAIIKELLRLVCVKTAIGTWSPTGENVNRIYRGTPEGSPLRRLIVDIHVTKGKKDWLSPNANAEFLMDMSKALYDVM